MSQGHRDRAGQIRQQALNWLEHAQKEKLVAPSQKIKPSRSQIETGISVEYLARFAASIRHFPLLPSKTVSIVKELVAEACRDRRCKLVDLVPDKHIGYPSFVVSHAWSADFLELVQTLYEDFQRRWEAHKTYRLRLKGISKPSSNDLAALDPEKKKMLGYYVWLDVFSVNHCEEHTLNVAQMSRLIHVVGRSLLILDEEMKSLTRSWCLYEVWCAINHNKQVFALTTPSANATADASDVDDSCGDKVSGSKGSIPPLSLLHSQASMDTDRAAILATWQHEVQSPKTRVSSFEALTAVVRDTIVEAHQRERRSLQLLQLLYAGLAECSKNWRSSLPSTAQELHGARRILREVAEAHFAKQLHRAKGLQAALDQDPELELWQLMTFLSDIFERQKEDGFWITELRRYARLAHKSFAARFSNGYVDSLFRCAGTFDDMGKLAQYVYSQCRHRIVKRDDSGDKDEDDEAGLISNSAPTSRRQSFAGTMDI